MRCVAVSGREFIYPLDMELLPTPGLNPDNSQALFKYLRDVSTSYQFTISVFKTIIIEMRTAHRERWNKGK